MSHRPWIVPEPFTPEPCETYSKEDIDYWAAAMKRVADEAYDEPEVLASAPHRQACHRIRTWERFVDPGEWAVTWRAYLRKHGGGGSRDEHEESSLAAADS